MPKALIVSILADAKQFGAELDRAAGKSRAFGKAAGVAGLAIAGGLAYGVEKSAVAAIHYQDSMTLLRTQAGASAGEVKRMSQALIDLAPSVGQGPQELSTGLYHLESQGLRSAHALDALRTAAQGAQLGHANLEDVTNALGAVLVSKISGVHSYAQAMGMLNATVGSGDMRMQDLADAMGTGLPANAAVAHVSLQQISAALAVFGDNNIRGAKAGTLLNSTMRVLGHQSTAGIAALQDLGVSSDVLQKKLSTQGLTGAVDYLSQRIKASGKSTAQIGSDLSEAFGGKQAGGIKILIDQIGRLHTKLHEVGKGGKSFGSDWATYSKTAAAGWDRLKASMQALEISLGSALLPTIDKVVSALAAAGGWLAKHKTLAEILVGVLGTLAVTLMAVSAATWALNTALDANPVVLITVALVALGVALYEAWTHSQTFREIVTAVFDAVKTAALDVAHFFTTTLPNFFVTAWHDVERVFSGALSWLEGHWRIFLGLPGLIWQYWGPISKVLRSAWDGVKTAFKGAIDWVEGVFTDFWHALEITALKIVLAIVEPFSHLPSFLGGWARSAKTAVQNQLDAIDGMDAKLHIEAIQSALYQLGNTTVHPTIQALELPASVVGAPPAAHNPNARPTMHVPGHDTGGIVVRGHLAWVHAGEAILPLSHQTLNRYGLGPGAGGMPSEIHVHNEIDLGDGRYMRETRKLALRQSFRGNAVFA